MGCWKDFERHPLSAEYADLAGQDWAEFLSGFQADGFDEDKPIILFQGKVLDGWQRQLACVACDIQPKYQELSRKWHADPERYVRRHNDKRRHESREAREDRLRRVAKARAEGRTTRQIADTVGVSRQTVLNDLKDLRDSEDSSVDKNVTTAAKESSAKSQEGVGKPRAQDGRIPKDDEVVGRDGKIYRKSKPKKLCGRCARVGVTQDCRQCAELRRPKMSANPNHDAANAAGRKRAGKVTFQTKAFDEPFGKLVRVVDAAMAAHGKVRSLQTIQEHLEVSLNLWNSWKKALR